MIDISEGRGGGKWAWFTKILDEAGEGKDNT